SLLSRAEQFGLDLAATHTVLVTLDRTPFRDATPVVAAVEDAALRATGGGAVLVTTQDGQLVTVVPTGNEVIEDRTLQAPSETLSPAGPGPGENGPGVELDPTWRCGVGRSYPGPAGIRQSYDE